MNDNDRKIKEWVEKRAEIKTGEDQDSVNRVLDGLATIVFVEIVKGDGFSKEWIAVESKTNDGVLLLKEAEEISKKISKMSSVVQVVVIKAARSSTEHGPKWGHPIADQRAEKIS